MNGTASQIKLVRAVHNFKASNNDELCFSKGDVITITQAIDGGWWEGTLNGVTGWFPSNYVKEIKQDLKSDPKSPSVRSDGPALAQPNVKENSTFYRSVVLQNLVDTEKSYVTDLQLLLQNFLRPLRTSNLLPAAECQLLCGNLEDVTAAHQNLLSLLSDCTKLPQQQQRIGGIFMKLAPQLQTLNVAYSSNHPKAARILQSRKEELNRFMESRGAAVPGIMSLTTSLSKPFSRLEKYSNLLKELQRHTDEGHVDRGDTQRAISIYREMAEQCIDVRKQKEMEFEIMKSQIRGWSGEDLSQLGEVQLLSPVGVIKEEGGDRQEQIMILFASTLVFVSVTPHLSGYMFQSQLPVAEIKVTALENTETMANAMEIATASEKRTVCCRFSQERRQWLEALGGAPAPLRVKSPPPTLPVVHSTPSLSSSGSLKAASLPRQQMGLSPSPSVVPYAAARKVGPSGQPTHKPARPAWSVSCLRPSAPVRPCLIESKSSPKPERKLMSKRKHERAFSEDEYVCYKKIEDSKTLEEDAQMLRVVEAYCTCSKNRQTVNSLDLSKLRMTQQQLVQDALLDCPQVLIANEEKIIVEEVKGDQTVVEEKTLVDTVYLLRDAVRQLKDEQDRMRKEMEEERMARRRVEVSLRSVLLKLNSVNSKDDSLPLS